MLLRKDQLPFINVTTTLRRRSYSLYFAHRGHRTSSQTRLSIVAPIPNNRKEGPAGLFCAPRWDSTCGEGPRATWLPDWLVAWIGRSPRAVRARVTDMAEVGKAQAGLGLPGGGAAQWSLQRYGRFMPSGAGEVPVPGLEAGTASSPTWKVFDSSEESGYLVLTIVISGHFFISQGQTLLEGFSLINSKSWLKIVRRMDCLLFGTTIKNKSRMFRVQFHGESKEQALEHCCSCVQNLAQYITVQVPEGIIQELRPSPDSWAGESRGKGCVESVTLQPGSHFERQQRVTAQPSAPEESISVTQLAQSFLASEQLPLIYEQSAWGAEELGPFLRLCLMDQNFPAFVEEVEKELKKLTGLRN
ncbi:meiotic recombination protein REC114 isoform X1 [Tamandua tetradactyla]|uniref:meiotic recombination protein REC114 isoform X1 n=1 Tax=Tamandua tetradactyla TaxID=48850 RepID=UPI0040540008